MKAESRPSENAKYIRWLIAILIVSITARVGAAIVLGDQIVDLPGTSDQLSYHTLATQVLGGKGFTFPVEWWPVTAAGAPTAHWSFLYTFYLIGVYFIFGEHPLAARLLQAAIVGLAHPLLVFAIGRRVFGPKTGIIAAGITAIYSYFIYYSGTLMTEPFYITSILAALYLAILIGQRSFTRQDRKPQLNIHVIALYLGLALAMTVLLRQLFLLIIPFILIWVLWSGGRSRLVPVIIAGITVLLVILPYTLFNYARFNRFVLLNTNAGYALYMGNHPIYGTKFIPILESEMYIRLIPPELRSLDEAALDQELLKRGIKFVTQDPVRYLLLSVSRIPPYFMFWPSRESGTISNISRVGSFGLFLPFMLYGMGRALIESWKPFREMLSQPVFLLGVFMLVYSLVHLLTWALIRYRLPVDGIAVIFAGYAFSDIYQKIIVWRRSAAKQFLSTPGPQA